MLENRPNLAGAFLRSEYSWRFLQGEQLVEMNMQSFGDSNQRRQRRIGATCFDQLPVLRLKLRGFGCSLLR